MDVASAGFVLHGQILIDDAAPEARGGGQAGLWAQMRQVAGVVFGLLSQSRRQFFTMPWTTTPNDPAGDFGQWLYDVPPTKKEQGLMLKPLRRPNGLL